MSETNPWINVALLGNKLKLFCLDLSHAHFPKCQLLICNLIIEHIGINMFASLLQRTDFEIASCVIQKNEESPFVSPSPFADKLDCLSEFHRDIGEEALAKILRFAKRQAVYSFGFSEKRTSTLLGWQVC
ncbi:MAG: hypothetical protein FWC28_05030 [Proteobacteria bacterium]|nr:hypothetical protein [Cystobacterineae bacterium]MCL2259043.1 hypothetical protein [Cystobacterineae bacterium]MCL2314601.1 hypothetical protein [Pseudomonadota bacterium]